MEKKHEIWFWGSLAVLSLINSAVMELDSPIISGGVFGLAYSWGWILGKGSTS